jgi:hypothetical protein
MRTELGTIKGDVDVIDEFALLGVVLGSIRVRKGGVFRLIGKVSGDVVVEPGGETDLTGLVGGDAANTGGVLTVVGVVTGRLLAQAGRTRLDENAVVRGGVLGEVDRIKVTRIDPA